MRILLVSNQVPNSIDVGNPIMFRMKESLSLDNRIERVDFYPIFNSIKSLKNLRKSSRHYDIIHVHFGGLYALIIYLLLVGIKVKKYITFHGTDIHAKALKSTKSKVQKIKIWLNQKSSFFSLLLYDKCGFVSEDLKKYVPLKIKKRVSNKLFVQNLGVNYKKFQIIDKEKAQTYLGLPPYKYVLFSDVSNTPIKRRDIAEKIITFLGNDYRLLIMTKIKNDDVPYYINACDFAILTSDEEGSPNIIREVLSLNKPFFSVNVGDAMRQLSGLNNSAIISRDPKRASDQIKEYMKREYTDYTRESKRNILDFERRNKYIVDMYEADLIKHFA